MVLHYVLYFYGTIIRYHISVPYEGQRKHIFMPSFPWASIISLVAVLMAYVIERLISCRPSTVCHKNYYRMARISALQSLTPSLDLVICLACRVKTLLRIGVIDLSCPRYLLRGFNMFIQAALQACATQVIEFYSKRSI